MVAPRRPGVARAPFGSYWWYSPEDSGICGTWRPLATRCLMPCIWARSAFPSPSGLAPASSVASFLFNRHDWRMYFLPGLAEAFGPAWWAVLGLDRFRSCTRGLCRCNPAAAPAHNSGYCLGCWPFVFLPQPLTVPVLYPRVPYNFVYNLLIISFPFLIIGFLILPIIPVMARAPARWLLLGSFGILLMVTQLDSTIWPIPLFSEHSNQRSEGSSSRVRTGDRACNSPPWLVLASS